MSEKWSILWDNDADGGGSGQSSDDDGEARVSPSHGSQSAFNADVGDHISGDQDLSADAKLYDDDDRTSSGSPEFGVSSRQQKLMEQRREQIRKRRMKRLGYSLDDDSDSASCPSPKKQKTPYRQLDMPQHFTPPRKQKVVVPASDESEQAETDEEQQLSSGRKRVYKTNWSVVSSWSKDRIQEAEIRREVDAILEKSLKDAGYRAEHVSKTKETDRAYWKEAHVSLLISDFGTPTHDAFFRRTAARTIPRNTMCCIGARCNIFVDVWCSSKFVTPGALSL